MVRPTAQAVLLFLTRASGCAVLATGATVGAGLAAVVLSGAAGRGETTASGLILLWPIIGSLLVGPPSALAFFVSYLPGSVGLPGPHGAFALTAIRVAGGCVVALLIAHLTEQHKHKAFPWVLAPLAALGALVAAALTSPTS